MIFVLTLFLGLLTISLGIWVYRLKASLKEHFILENELQYEVGHDALTGLINSSLLIDRLDQSIKNAERHEQKVAILYLQVNYFKQINTASGFDITNEFLQILSQKLLECVHEDDSVSRVQGDEFVIVIDHFEELSFIQGLLDNIMAISDEILSVNHHRINFTFSIGISLYPNDKVDTMSLLNHAYTAMKLIKTTTSHGYKYYTLELGEEAFKNEKLEYELIEALDDNQMEVYYQPQFNIQNEVITGVEACVRWRHPTMGLITAEEFIVLSEEIGFITTLDTWIIEKSIRQFIILDNQDLTLSINVSMLTLQQDDFLEKINILLEDNTMNERLSFEIREYEFISISDEGVDKLKELSALGIKFTLDNFGSASSSLKNLKKSPIDTIKIDRYLIMNFEDNKEVIKTIIDIAKNMDMTVVANGVQSQEVRDFLLEHSCTKAQGHMYNKGSSLEEVEKSLSSLLAH